MMLDKRYNFEVIHGSIFNRVTECLIQEPGVLIMKDTGAPIRIGEYADCERRYADIVARMPAEFVNEQYELIKFNVAYPNLDFQPDGYYLTVDEICTLFNYLQNFTIGADGWSKLRALSLDDLKKKLSEVQTWIER